MSARRMLRTWRPHRRGAQGAWAGSRDRPSSFGHVSCGLPGRAAPAVGRSTRARRGPLTGRGPLADNAPLAVEILGGETILRAALERVVRGLPGIGTVTVLALDQPRAEAGPPDPDVILVVVQSDNDIAALGRCLADRVDARAIAVAESCDPDRLRRLIEAGSSGCVLFEADPGEVAHAIRAVADGRVFIDPRSIRLLASGNREAEEAHEADMSALLSERHTEILRLLAAGLPNKLIAQRLEITEKTVKAHLTAIFRRIGVSDRLRAARWAAEHLGPEQPQAEESAGR